MAPNISILTEMPKSVAKTTDHPDTSAILPKTYELEAVPIYAAPLSNPASEHELIFSLIKSGKMLTTATELA